MKKNSGVISIIILTLIPLILWYPEVTKPLTLRNLSQALALSGTVLFSLNFVLSGRLKSLESYFGGLNKIYLVHHLIGQIALIFLLFHPVFLGFYYLGVSAQAAFSILFPTLWGGYATWFGIAAILSLTILLFLTLYVKLPYHIWKATHKFIGVSLVFASLHILFVESTVSVNQPLNIYMLLICSLGLIAYAYRVVLGRILVKRYKYKVSDIQIEQNVCKITLTPANLPKSAIVGQSDTKAITKHLPGQFIFVGFSSLGITPEYHPFSLTNKPGELNISIAAKSSGDYTETLKLLKVGSPALVEGPFGRFTYLASPRQKQIWIAGGIGVTPFVSMAKDLVGKNDYDIKLYYLVPVSEEAVFAALLTKLDAELPNLTIRLITTKSQGRLTADRVAKDVPDIKDRDIFVCGPAPMMQDLRKQFNATGIRNSHIISEEFSLD